MDGDRPCHPWVAGLRDRITFALQAVAGRGDADPGKQLLHAGRLADEYGFDAFFLGDHPAWAPECWAHLFALAVQTRRVRLGQMVAAAPYRPPLLTARLASDLDRLSDGRRVPSGRLGLGIGWNAADYGLGTNEFDRMGLPYPSTRERQAALEEYVAIIRGVWGPEPFTFRGRYHSTVDERVGPPPVQRPGPPLLLAGAGERALRLVAQYADACNFSPGHATGLARTPEDVRRKLAVLRGHCEAIGRPYDHVLRTHFTTWLMLAENEAGARAKLSHYYPQGVNEEQRYSRVATTPTGAVAYYQALADAGIQYFVVQSLDAADEETIHLLAEEVAPHVRPAPPTRQEEIAQGS